jgi:Helix-turn-helix
MGLLMSTDRMRTIEVVKALAGARLSLRWSDGTEAEFRKVRLGDWGHSIAWPNGAEIGAGTLWLDTLRATGREDAAQFLAWRLRNGLSLTKAAEALGLARRTVAYYSNGERRIPKAILLACKGWDASGGMARAA